MQDESDDKMDVQENQSEHDESNEDEDNKMIVENIEPSAAVDDDEDEVSKDAPELQMDDQTDSNSGMTKTKSDEKEIDDDAKQKKIRSRSSSGEIHDDSNDKMEVDKSAKREQLQKETPKTAVEVEVVTKTTTVTAPAAETKTANVVTSQRKRKWGARKADNEPVIAITTDSLKNVISEEIKPVPLSDVKLNMSPSPEREPEEKRVRTTSEERDAKKKSLKERLRLQEEEEDRRNDQIAKAIERSQVTETIVVTNGSGKDRKVSVVTTTEDAQPPTPPKNQLSNVLIVTNLVRPLTLMAIKSLLARTGQIEDFWIDAIKSKCFVRYATEDEAFETRQALHGVTWPSHNLKTLHVEFSTQEEMDAVSVSSIGERVRNASESRETKPQDKGFGWTKQDAAADDRSKSSRRVREWDVGKKDDAEREDRDKERRRRRSSERESNRRDRTERKNDENVEKRKSASASPDREDDKNETVAVQPGRLLDDLFRKTKATPCIYWMPLSEEQINEKEEQRQKNIAEHNRRMEEMLKQQKERREARELRMKKENDERRDRRRSNSRDKRRRNSRERPRRSVSRDRRYNNRR